MQAARRRFLKSGVLGALLLAVGGAFYRAVQAPASAPRFILDGDARAVLAAIVPAMLGAALPSAAAQRSSAIAAAIAGVEQAIRCLPLATQKEVQDLLGLLAVAAVRRLMAGVAAGWADADAQQVAAFLQRWRTHRFALMQTAYHALHDLILGAWYAQPANWAAIGYPGPASELV